MSDHDRKVVIDTMAMSALVNSSWRPERAAEYRSMIAGRDVIISFVTVTELRYGAAKAGWGDLRRRTLEKRIAEVTVVTPDDDLMTVCAEFRLTCEQSGHALAQKFHEADRWIAASALHLGVQLISDDTVYTKAPGLSLRSNRGA